AVTVALEHITAIGANVLLQNPILMQDVEPKYKELWYWHAVEESEHKAVAFDVFQAVSGNYWLRILPLVVMTITFIPSIVVLQLISLRRDKLSSDAKKMDENKALLEAVKPALVQLRHDYMAYYRKDFHPWDLDNRDVINQWKKLYQETGKAAV
ncbi:MAG TPA: metal-dependent hydrolase, partial [Gammaproteobacteria bacterium]|nr:metal-dependent hydrolase [Gammaproteobacteria bacterium]